jgi:hypothetical protein
MVEPALNDDEGVRNAIDELPVSKRDVNSAFERRGGVNCSHIFLVRLTNVRIAKRTCRVGAPVSYALLKSTVGVLVVLWGATSSRSFIC